MFISQQRADLVKQVPGFWAAVLVNHGRISELITEQDEEALQYLTRLDVKEFDDIKSGYKIDCVSRRQLASIDWNSFNIL